MGADEESTLARLKAHRGELIDPKITEHRGRVVKKGGTYETQDEFNSSGCRGERVAA